MSEQNILEVKDLTKHFKAGKKQIVHAVDGISFTLKRGKTLGLVGESGCGKSSCARTIIRMYDPTAGQIILETIEKYYKENAMYALQETKFHLAELGNDAGIYGAVRMVLFK